MEKIRKNTSSYTLQKSHKYMFVQDINKLNETIIKYYNQHKIAINNINNIISTTEDELYLSEEDIQIPSNILIKKKLKEIFNTIKKEINANKRNLNLFLENAQNIFKILKDKYTLYKNKPINYNTINIIKNSKSKSAPKKRNNLGIKSNINNNIFNNVKDNNKICLELINEKHKYQHSISECINLKQIEFDDLKILKEEKNFLKLKIQNLEKEISNIRKKISEEIRKNDELKKKQEELKKIISDKDKELENYKITLNNKDSDEKKILLESVKSIYDKENSTNNYKPWENLTESVNRICKNFIIENENLKEAQNAFKNKINYLQGQLVNIKNALQNEKIQIENLKNEKENKIIEINNELNNLKKTYTEMNEEKKILKSEIAARDIKIIDLELKIHNLKTSYNNLNDNNELNIKNQNKELTKQLEEQNKKIKDINEQFTKLIIENERNKQNLQRYIENKFPRDNIINDLKKKIEDLKEENDNLKNKNETLKNIIEAMSQINNNQSLNKFDKEYFELINLRIKDKEKFDKEKEILEKKIKELQNKYNELENKYNNLLKNENKSNVDKYI